jgi:hypothetical protein
VLCRLHLSVKLCIETEGVIMQSIQEWLCWFKVHQGTHGNGREEARWGRGFGWVGCFMVIFGRLDMEMETKREEDSISCS